MYEIRAQLIDSANDARDEKAQQEIKAFTVKRIILTRKHGHMLSFYEFH